jgi:hypothetical protein
MATLNSCQTIGARRTTNGSTIFKIGVYRVSCGGDIKFLLGIATQAKFLLAAPKQKPRPMQLPLVTQANLPAMLMFLIPGFLQP